MAVVDKSVTIRMTAEDQVTPALRAQARAADDLAAKLDRAGRGQGFRQVAVEAAKSERSIAGVGRAAQQAFSGAVTAGAARVARSLRDVGSEAGRTERALVAAGRATNRAFAGADRGLAPLRGRLNDAADAVDRVSEKYRGMESAGRGALVAGGAMAVGIGAVVKQYADFDKAMSSVQANTGATGVQLESLRQKAIELGGATQYSGEEAAQGINELAKAGVSTTAILNGGLKGALSLAAAGQMEVADAAETAASAMTQFGLSGTDVPHIADLLAAGANKAQGSVKDMGDALNQVGLVAHGTGLSIDETVGTLTAFASAGMIGSDAGTSLKTMLQRLTPQSEEASKTMKALGLSAYDSQGQFVGMVEYAGRLQSSMAGLSPEARNAAMNIMFGADAVRAANILFEQGAVGMKQWQDQIKLAGFASQNAAALTNNLSGDMERFGGAIDTVVLQSGSGLNDFLRSVVQNGTAAVDAFGRIPGPVLEVGLAFGAVTTAVTLAGGAMMVLVPKVIAGHAALVELAAGGSLASASMLGLSRALGIAGVALGAMWGASKVAEWAGGAGVAKVSADQLSASLAGLASNAQNAGGAFVELMSTAKFDVFGQNPRDAAEALDLFGESAKRVTDPTVWNRVDFMGQGRTMGEFGAQVKALDAAFATMVQNGQVDQAQAAFDQLMASVKANGGNVEEVAGMFGQYTAAAAEAGDATSKLSVEQAKAEAEALGMTDAQYKQASAAEKAAAATDTFKSKIESLGNTMLAQRDAQRGFEAAIDEVAKSVAENGRTLDITTAAGRANQSALDGVATSGLKAAAELYNTTGSLQQTANAVERTRSEFVQAAQDMGMPKAQAEALADSLGMTTEQVQQLAATLPSASGNINIGVNTQALGVAQQGIAQLQQQMDLPPIVMKTPIMGNVVQSFGLLQGYADQINRMNPQMHVSQQGAEQAGQQIMDATAAGQAFGGLDAIARMQQQGAQQAGQQAQAATGKVQEFDRQKAVADVQQQGAQQAGKQTADATSKVREYDRQNATANVNVAGTETAKSKIQGLISKLRELVSRPFLATVRTIGGMAHGGILEAYANGGIRGLLPHVRAFANGTERHVAQIAPAGAYRLWAEEETGGEAYIPLAKAKRARSAAILEEVARRFGYSLVKQAEGGLLAFASGGMTAAQTGKGAAATLKSIAGSPTIAVTAKITKVVVPPNVQAPFLYTPGGKWDRSTSRLSVASDVAKRYADLFITKAELTEFARKNYEAQKALAEAGSKAFDGGGGGASGVAGALASAPKSIARIIEKYARQYKVDANLIASVIKAESAFNKKARSRVGAMGLMQLMPGTARKLGVKNAYDADQNIKGGTKYLADLIKTFGGDIRKAVAAYNAGPARVKSGKALPAETQAYLRKVLGTSSSAVKSTAKAVASGGGGLVVSMIENAKQLVGRYYRWGGGHDSNSHRSDLSKALVDCSGLINTALGHTLRQNVNRVAADWTRGKGIQSMSVQQGLKTAGAFLGTNSHVVISMGDGTVLEAPSRGKKVRIRKASAREFSRAGWDTRLGSAVQASYAQLSGGGASSSEMSRLADATKDAAEAAREYAAALKAYKTPAYVTANSALKASTADMTAFYGNLRKIRDRGYPGLALRIMQMGDEGAAELAASLAKAPAATLRQTRDAFEKNVTYADYGKRLEESLTKVSGPAAWVTASRETAAASKTTQTFLDDVLAVGKRQPELAWKLLAMGEDEGGDIARTAAQIAKNASGDAQMRQLRGSLVEGTRAATVRAGQLAQAASNAEWAAFLRDVDRLRTMGYGTLADTLLDMGPDKGADIAAQAVRMAPAELRGLRRQYVEDPARNNLTQTISRAVGAKAATAGFLANIRRIRDRGYPTLALKLMEMGEDSAGTMAAEAAKAADADMRAWQDSTTASDALATQADQLMDQLRGIGAALNVQVGQVTGSDPAIRYTAPRPVDARPAPAQYLVGPQGGQRGPLMTVENMWTADPAAAVTQMETRLGDAVAVTGLGRMI